MTEQHLTLQGNAQVNEAGQFEIVAITAGEGNGWTFSEQVLKDSIPLWDNASCFVDHSYWGMHSVRDLAGVFSEPRWDETRRGIKLTLSAIGPAAPQVEQLGRDLLKDGPKPNVGFSADVYFQPAGGHGKSRQREVLSITRVASIDLVINPARGGTFVRALNQSPAYGREGVEMADIPEAADTPNVGRVAPTSLKGEVGPQEDLQATRLQMSENLLEITLTGSKLPAPMQEHIRKQFAGYLATGRTFPASELQSAVDDARDLVSQLSGAASVVGPRIHGMFSSEDQLQAAVDDLMGAPREKALEGQKVARLSGIRELYLMLTGDDDLHGGYYPSRARLATTADFTGLVKNALNKIVANQWGELGRAGYDWWMRVTTQEQFSSLQQITGTLTGTVGSLPTVAEGAEYTELPIGDSPETADFTKYGGYIPLTLELIDRDETRKLRAYPRELANAGLRKISALVSAIFTANAGIGPTMADTGALFNATAVTTAGGHANLLTTALSSAQWETVAVAVYNQPMLIKNAAGLYGTGSKQAVNPKYCLVPRALELTAKKILYPMWENTATITSENLQRGNEGDVVTVPEWTDANDWAAAIDPRIVPGIFVGTRFGIMPEVFTAGNELSPAVFMNDEHRLKVRHFVAVWVNDFRPLHKSNV